MIIDTQPPPPPFFFFFWWGVGGGVQYVCLVCFSLFFLEKEKIYIEQRTSLILVIIIIIIKIKIWINMYCTLHTRTYLYVSIVPYKKIKNIKNKRKKEIEKKNKK